MACFLVANSKWQIAPGSAVPLCAQSVLGNEQHTCKVMPVKLYPGEQERQMAPGPGSFFQGEGEAIKAADEVARPMERSVAILLNLFRYTWTPPEKKLVTL